MKKQNLARCFICIEFPPEAVKEIERIQKEISKVAFKGKLTELHNLHLTLKFLGEIDKDKLELVKKSLGKIKFKTMKLSFGRTGLFSRRKNPAIVWINIEGEDLFTLQDKIDIAMEKLGFKKEVRFMSHITLARIKEVKEKDKFAENISKIKGRDIKLGMDNFKLKSSDLKENGPIYKDIEVYLADSII